MYLTKSCLDLNTLAENHLSYFSAQQQDGGRRAVCYSTRLPGDETETFLMCSQDPPETWICSFCIGESYLRDLMEKTGTQHSCHYCGETGFCFSLENITDLTETAIGQHYVRTPDTPSDMEYAWIKHSDHEWFRKGEDIDYVIENLLETAPAVAQDIQEVLEERHRDWDSMVAGQETEFASGSYYTERKSEDTRDLELMWDKFVSSLKTESRYINPSVIATLDGIFNGIEHMQGPDSRPVILEAGPGTDMPSLYRARYSTGHTVLEQMLILPDRELGPPPHRLSGSNRMSARGISVFYGASAVDTAISEIRPPVGSTVVSARFNLIRPLRLLNLPALEYLRQQGSMLDPSFIIKRRQVAFLSRLTRRIVIPVLPGEEDFEYIPTQVIAEYLADDTRLGLDGMLYPSVQQSGGSSSQDYNVVLFHKASRINYLALPEKKDCRISYGREYSEDEWETDIRVIQYSESAPQPAPWYVDYDAPLAEDMREPALEIDLASVSFHDIRAARFEYGSEPVSREKQIS